MANEPTIEIMDKAIAEFMEFETSKEPYLSYSRTMYLVRGYWWPLRKLKYHTSWDWLRPVWDKFRDLKFSEETAMKLHLNYVARLAQDIAYGTIEEFHNNLSISIQWYNQQKQKDEVST